MDAWTYQGVPIIGRQRVVPMPCGFDELGSFHGPFQSFSRVLVAFLTLLLVVRLGSWLRGMLGGIENSDQICWLLVVRIRRQRRLDSQYLFLLLLALMSVGYRYTPQLDGGHLIKSFILSRSRSWKEVD